MATLTLTFTLELDGGGLQTERITPDSISLTVGGKHLRQTVAITSDFQALLVGDIAPRRWFFYNPTGSGSNAILSMGSEDDVTLAPGEYAWIPSMREILARSASASGSLMYAVMEA